MTAANAGLLDDESQPNGIVIFNVPITPEVLGVIVGVLGIGLAGFLGYKLLMPTLQTRTTLEADIQAKKDNIAQQENKLKKRQEAEQKLQEAERRLAFVSNFFPSAETLETLLFDANDIINQINSGIRDDDKKARLVKFEPVPPPEAQANQGGDPSIVGDGSLGLRVNGKLKRKQFRVEFLGTFAQTQAFLTALERMQSLLVVKNLKSKLDSPGQDIFVEVQPGGKYVPLNNQEPKLRTTFDLHALLPLTEKEKEEEEAAAAAQPAQ